jgi:hypothetical protein
VTDKIPVLPVKIVNPPSELAEAADIETDPEDRFRDQGPFRPVLHAEGSKIQAILEQTSKAVFNVITKVSHSEHNIHFTYD